MAAVHDEALRDVGCNALDAGPAAQLIHVLSPLCSLHGMAYPNESSVADAQPRRRLAPAARRLGE